MVLTTDATDSASLVFDCAFNACAALLNITLSERRQGTSEQVGVATAPSDKSLQVQVKKKLDVKEISRALDKLLSSADDSVLEEERSGTE